VGVTRAVDVAATVSTKGVGVVRTRLSPAPARMVDSGINLVPVTAHHDPSRASRPKRLSAPNAEPRWGSAFSFLV
jgi:hypothetical protein